MNKNSARFLNYLLLFALFFGVYLWSSVYRNAEANPSGFEAQISFLDVGQGDAALINLPESTQVLIDGGRGSFVLDKIRSRMPSGDKKIEYVVASHPDADHIGGLESVVESYNVGEFIETNADSSSNTFKGLQSALEQKKVKTVRASTGDKFNFATGAEGEVLWPKSDVSGLSSNDASIVLKFDYKGATALFTGDAELEAQNGVLAKHSADKIKTEVYKVPHHGSGGALDLKFLEAVVPKYAVVSVGKNNSYGHPAQTVLDALGKVKAQIFRTDQEGTIDFATNGASWTKRE